MKLFPSVFALITCLLITTPSEAQQKMIFLELAGSGGLGSINYERPVFFKIRNHTGWDGDDGVPVNMFTLRTGFSFTPIDKNNGIALVFPIMGNIIHGKKTHRIEMGAGLAPTITTKGAWYVKSPLMFGYRYQPSDKIIFARLSYTPIVGWLVDFQWQHWFGISIGIKLS